MPIDDKDRPSHPGTKYSYPPDFSLVEALGEVSWSDINDKPSLNDISGILGTTKGGTGKDMQAQAGVSRPKLLRLNPDGTMDASLEPSQDGQVPFVTGTGDIGWLTLGEQVPAPTQDDDMLIGSGGQWTTQLYNPPDTLSQMTDVFFDLQPAVGMLLEITDAVAPYGYTWKTLTQLDIAQMTWVTNNFAAINHSHNLNDLDGTLGVSKGGIGSVGATSSEGQLIYFDAAGAFVKSVAPSSDGQTLSWETATSQWTLVVPQYLPDPSGQPNNDVLRVFNGLAEWTDPSNIWQMGNLSGLQDVSVGTHQNPTTVFPQFLYTVDDGASYKWETNTIFNIVSNLLDKSAAETVSGDWKFTGAPVWLRVRARDVRDSTQMPGTDGTNNYMPDPADSFLDRNFMPIFSKGWPGAGDWAGILNLKAWQGSTSYTAWQLAGPASSDAVNELYFRVGAGTTWNPWRTVLFAEEDATVSGIWTFESTVYIGGSTLLQWPGSAGPFSGVAGTNRTTLKLEIPNTTDSVGLWFRRSTADHFFGIDSNNDYVWAVDGGGTHFMRLDTGVRALYVNGNKVAQNAIDETVTGAWTFEDSIYVSGNAPSITFDDLSADAYTIYLAIRHQGARRWFWDFGTSTSEDIRLFFSEGAAGSETNTQVLRFDHGTGEAFFASDVHVSGNEVAVLAENETVTGHWLFDDWVEVRGTGTPVVLRLRSNDQTADARTWDIRNETGGDLRFRAISDTGTTQQLTMVLNRDGQINMYNNLTISDGTLELHIPGTYTGGKARGVHWYEDGGLGRMSGIGLYGSDGSPAYLYIAAMDTPWTNWAIRVDQGGKDMRFAGDVRMNQGKRITGYNYNTHNYLDLEHDSYDANSVLLSSIGKLVFIADTNNNNADPVVEFLSENQDPSLATTMMTLDAGGDMVLGGALTVNTNANVNLEGASGNTYVSYNSTRNSIEFVYNGTRILEIKSDGLHVNGEVYLSL